MQYYQYQNTNKTELVLSSTLKDSLLVLNILNIYTVGSNAKQQ